MLFEAPAGAQSRNVILLARHKHDTTTSVSEVKRRAAIQLESEPMAAPVADKGDDRVVESVDDV
jgi:hypothetical protein